jgi:thiamine-monophosphate kinase
MSAAGEFDLIDLIKRLTQGPSARVEVGIGDDAAVIRAGSGKQLLCSDCMVEGVHFDLTMMSPADVAYKALATCLSDIAAMGGTPIAVVLSLALPKEKANEKFVTAFCKGIEKLRADLLPVQFDFVGGDLSSSPGPIFIDVACTGETARPILRSGAKPGDQLAVSGWPGTSAAGLYGMQNWKTIKELSGALTQAHTRPLPRFDLSQKLDSETCHALIDVSDGLASEANHLAKASNVKIEIIQEKIPSHERIQALADRTNQSALDWALFGGEDYELLACFSADAQIPDGFTLIGRVLETGATGPAVTLVKPNGEKTPLGPGGFNHFAPKPPASEQI